MNDLAVFAGAGGGLLANEQLGDTTVCAVERDAYAASILAQRQNDGALPLFPIWSDVRTFDARAWRGIVDSVSGGFPCQDISIAGTGAGLDGERSGLWRELLRVVCDAEPWQVRVENSPMLTSRGLGVILGDLAALGFDARWDVLSAADLGAPHIRERIWIVASNTDRLRQLQLERLKPEEWRRGLATALKKFPTLVARDYRYPGRSRLDRTGSKAGEHLPNSIGGPLNPDWCEWFMGWPVEWTASKPLAMAKYHEWRRQHLPLSPQSSHESHQPPLGASPCAQTK